MHMQLGSARRLGVLAAATLLLGVPLCGMCQSYDVDIVQSVRDAPVRSHPDANSETAFTAAKGITLVWAAHMESSGFYRVVRRDKGPVGWIDANDVRVTQEHKHGASQDDPDNQVCAATLDACPARGCAKEGSWEAEANAMKRRRPESDKAAVLLTFDDLKSLQKQADEKVGQGPYDLTPHGYQKLTDLNVSAGSVSEGDLVRVVAYIAKGQDGLHVNKAGESVNCNLKRTYDNDFHIPVVAMPGDTEFKGIVVEMIPQARPSAWTIDALKKIQAKGTQVLVVGGLSYDKVHYVSDDPDHPFKDEPDRMSLWEIHPITDFLVCKRDQCDPNRQSDWANLEAQQVAGD
jgi:hypothetical protein